MPYTTVTDKDGKKHRLKHMSKKEMKAHGKQSDGMHRVWHIFNKEIRPNGKWMYIGSDLEDKVEEFAKRFPNDVFVSYCDDTTFCSSTIALFEHKCATKYMGTSMLLIPQHDGEPSEVFLYPGHQLGLIRSLQALGKLPGNKTIYGLYHKSVGMNKFRHIYDFETRKKAAAGLKSVQKASKVKADKTQWRLKAFVGKRPDLEIK